jgi:glycerate dehydrogenase
MVFAHLLNLTQRVADHGRSVAAGRWSRIDDFCYWEYPLVELAGLTLGVIGFGRIGRATAEIARAMGMRVLAYDVAPPAGAPPEEMGTGASLPADTPGTASCCSEPVRIFSGVRFVGLEELFRQSDVISLHCPLTAETHKLVNHQRLGLMKPSAYLINTSRGPVVDEQALAEALNAGRIAGAGLDVLATEPPAADNPLFGAKNCCITPHIAWASRAARQRLLNTAVASVRAFLGGKPQNVVNP